MFTLPAGGEWRLIRTSLRPSFATYILPSPRQPSFTSVTRHIVITAYRHIRPLALIVNLHRGQKRCCSEGQFNMNGNLTFTAAILPRIEVIGLYIAQESEGATDKQLEWSSSDEAVATVDQEWLVTILNPVNVSSRFTK